MALTLFSVLAVGPTCLLALRLAPNDLDLDRRSSEGEQQLFIHPVFQILEGAENRRNLERSNSHAGNPWQSEEDSWSERPRHVQVQPRQEASGEKVEKRVIRPGAKHAAQIYNQEHPRSAAPVAASSATVAVDDGLPHAGRDSPAWDEPERAAITQPDDPNWGKPKSMQTPNKDSSPSVEPVKKIQAEQRPLTGDPLLDSLPFAAKEIKIKEQDDEADAASEEQSVSQSTQPDGQFADNLAPEATDQSADSAASEGSKSEPMAFKAPPCAPVGDPNFRLPCTPVEKQNSMDEKKAVEEKVVDAVAEPEAAEGDVVRNAGEETVLGDLEVNDEVALGVNKSSLSAHIYVINRVKRSDRWACMKSQLSDTNAPFPSTRFAAVEPGQVNRKCSYLKGSDIAQGGPAQGVMCSNYLIWKEALKGSAEWVIIFEDDVVMSKDIWEKVTDLLSSHCRSQFDYVAVDTFTGSGDGRKEAHTQTQNLVCDNASKGLGLYHLRGVGAQMQILRRESLQEMIHIAEGKKDIPVDKLNHKMGHSGHGVRTTMFQARIAAQYQSAKVQGVAKPTSQACKSSVGKSDIH